MEEQDLDAAIREAMRDGRLVEFRAKGLDRLGGETRSGPLPDWRRFSLQDMQDFRVLDSRIVAFRTTPAGAPSGWDQVFVSV